jgi:sulfite dehydrogenase (quinone) subunit SoeA
MTTPLTSNPPDVKFDDRSKQETHYTTCYMCACRCGIKVTTEAGKVRFIQGTAAHPTNQGVLCAKGSAGIMKQNSPAKLRNPMIRRPGTQRGDGLYDPISWDDALDMLTKRLAHIRATEPRKLAFFTGRDQMQALTGLWAQQFGTPNWAAHGGFCSVNMAAAGLYSIGYAFWEFGAPDWDHAKYFMLWGVAEDHSSNPIKIGLDKLKSRGAKFVSVNPVRTGYSAIADEWVPIRPGTDGLLALAMVHVLIERELFDWDFLAKYTNAPWLVISNPGHSDDGLFLRDAEGKPLVWDLNSQSLQQMKKGVAPALFHTSTVTAHSSPVTVRSTMQLMAERYTADEYSPASVAAECGVPAAQIERLALEMAHIAFKETITLPIKWTDVYGNEHHSVTGRPVAMYAMRGISAHSNGFQTCRALHMIQMLLGALEGPGNFRSKAPFPKPIPPHQLPENDATVMDAPNTPLPRTPLGFPTRPEELAIDAHGNPLRIDKAYSWESPIAAHGMMHMVIKNAANHDPYPIDTLILFMANMAWNSSMNTEQTQAMLRARGEDGEHKIPFIVVADAFDSEMVRFADLVLPDTTYLERYDAISLLDRPISEPDAAADAIRHPIIKVDRDVRPWQDVLVELASRLQFPAFTALGGARKFKDYPDFITNYERAPGIGFLSGFRGKDGDKPLRGEPNPNQWKAYIDAQAFFAYHWPDEMKYMRFVNKAYLDEATRVGFIGKSEPIVMQLYSEPLQKFRLAGQGLYAGVKPSQQIDKDRLTQYFDPLPIWYDTESVTRDGLPVTGSNAEVARHSSPVTNANEYPFHAITQRPMVMYHAWDSQNAWLRQILSQNFLYMNAPRAAELGFADFDWVWVESWNGKIRCQLKTMEGCEANTVWTWNAIGKMSEAWGLSKEASEATHGFLLNHLISESIPVAQNGRVLTNSDPITGQAAWYDLRVKIYKAAPGETGTWPKIEFGKKA